MILYYNIHCSKNLRKILFDILNRTVYTPLCNFNGELFYMLTEYLLILCGIILYNYNYLNYIIHRNIGFQLINNKTNKIFLQIYKFFTHL